MEILVAILVILLCVVIFMLYRQNSALSEAKGAKTQITTDITKLRNIGELSVFQIYSKEIVTRKDDPIGGFWKSVLGWSMTKKQIAVIFEFEINFIYDLRSKDFVIQQISDGGYKISMPPCQYKYSIKDMKIYDEKDARFLPFLLPDSLSGFFGVSFSESDKNKLIDEAKDEVKSMSIKIINDLGDKIHKSASDTLEAIAKNFGAKSVEFEFCDGNIGQIDVKKSAVEIDSFLEKQIAK
ncbi:DUF4230 domain-containing protein [Campylobacter geochelonis]|uniref:DUF4230 domain-containing protein n=1 Tax=Campylobacter geochelonis TaxID=1780362 RepID=UPI000770A51B|nr:DUF4230 domain-containing protein [Campylobacter geochelonis]CZE48209.1 membrane protein [Campylobacter geochelonis]CZE50020.1 membrane protein [Campylobacter geochelonis]